MADHIYGKLESVKFSGRRDKYNKSLKALEALDIPFEDLLHHYPAYVGDLTLSRFLTLYELYKMTENISGHIAEAGVFKGAGSIYFAKLVKLFESNSLTMVHGFDWFEGNDPRENDSDNIIKGGYKASFDEVVELVKIQGLDHILKIHKVDLVNDLELFFNDNKHLRFKLVFLDAGLYDVVSSCIKQFYDRMTTGGIMVFDQYNHELSPGETMAVDENLKHIKIRTLPNAWMPNAYIIKE